MNVEKIIEHNGKQYQISVGYNQYGGFIHFEFRERVKGKRKWERITPFCKYSEIVFDKGSQSINQGWLIKHLSENIPGFQECVNDAIEALGKKYYDSIVSFKLQ